MPSKKVLPSVAHNIMDHSVSGLGFLMDHVFSHCSKTGNSDLTINLLSNNPLPTASAALKASAAEKHKKFASILASAGFQLNDVRAAALHFQMLEDPKQKSWPRFTCECRLEMPDGKVFESKMDSVDYWMPKRIKQDPFEKIRRLRRGG